MVSPWSAAAQGIEQLAAGTFFSGVPCPSPSQAAIDDALGMAATATASQIGQTRTISISASSSIATDRIRKRVKTDETIRF